MARVKNIIIYGRGIVGSHVENEFIDQLPFIEDPKYGLHAPTDIIYDYGFICVPTEKQKDGSADISIVQNILNERKHSVKSWILRSTVPPGTCRALCVPNLVFVPEYYGATLHSIQKPDFAILGGNEDECDKVVQLFQTVHDGNFRFIFTSYECAEIAKYMENSWIGLKVTFCNEFADIANYFGVNYSELRECFIADPRVSPAHTFVFKEKPYYDSHCLNKDIPAIIAAAEKYGINTPLLSAMQELNRRRKERADTEHSA